MKYKLWVSAGEGQGRVTLLDVDEPEQVQKLTAALIGSAGSASYDVGVTLTAAEPPPSPPPPAEPQTQTPQNGQRPPATQQGQAGRAGRQ